MTRWELSDTARTVTLFSGKLARHLIKASYMGALAIPNDVPTLWYENDNGDKWYPDLEGELPSPPDGFIYQHSRFPHVLHHTILRMVVPEEVAKCSHPAEYVIKTGGWIDGIEGRECKYCGGTQVKKVTEEWPEKWEAYGSRPFMNMENGFSEDLALALTQKMGWSLSKAIIVAAIACERCMNALAHECGLKWGYAENSDDFKNTNTSCDFCKHIQAPVKTEAQCMQQELKHPYLHPAVIEKVKQITCMVWEMYYRAARDFLNKKLEDWASWEWQIEKILTSTDHDKDAIVELEQSPNGITVKFWGIPKIRGTDPKALADLLENMLCKPNRYLNINDDILHRVVELVSPINNHHIIYRAAIEAFDNECFEEKTMEKLIKYPELPFLENMIGEPVCLQYYTTPARRVVWALSQHNPQWEPSVDALNKIIDWISENFFVCLSNASSAYLSTNLDIFSQGMLPQDEFLDGFIDTLGNAERLKYLEETPVVIMDFAGHLHLISGVIRRRILNRNGEQTMRMWVLQATDVWTNFKKS